MLSTAHQLSDLPDGDYTYRILYGLTEEQLYTHPRTVEVPVTIKKKAPALSTAVSERNGRKILTITAQDPMLDNLMIFGIGTGSLVQKEGAEPPQSCNLEFVRDALTINSRQLIVTRGETDQTASDLIPGYSTIGVSAPVPSNISFNVLGGDQWFEQFDFSEFYRAEPDETGCFTLEYDITDMTAYHIAAVDRAFNIAEIDVPDESVRPSSVKPGIYRGTYGLYEFTADTVHYVPITNPVRESSYHYGISTNWIENRLDAVADLPDSIDEGWSCVISGTPETGYTLDSQFYQGDIWKEEFGTLNMVKDVLVPTDMETTEGYLAISAYDAETSYIRPLFHELTGCWKYLNLTRSVSPDAVVIYEADCCTKNLELIEHVRITLDMKTGIATLPDGSTRDLTKEKKLTVGDADCSGKVDVADAVLVARFLTEEKEAVMASQGIFLADCNHNNTLDSSDLTMILKAIAKKIVLD